MSLLTRLRLAKAVCAAGACAGVGWLGFAFPLRPEWLAAAVFAVTAGLIGVALLVLDPAIARAKGGARKGPAS